MAGLVVYFVVALMAFERIEKLADSIVPVMDRYLPSEFSANEKRGYVETYNRMLQFHLDGTAEPTTLADRRFAVANERMAPRFVEVHCA